MAFIKLLSKAVKAAAKKTGSKKKTKKAQTAKTQNRILKTVKAVAEDKKLVPKGLTGEAKKKYLANLKKKKQSEMFKQALASVSRVLKDMPIKTTISKDPVGDAMAKTKGLKIKQKDGTLVGAKAKERFKELMASKKASGTKAKKKAKQPELEMSMKTAKKKQMRDTAEGKLKSKNSKLGRKYDDIPIKFRRVIVEALRNKDAKKIASALKGTGMTKAEFVTVYKQRGKT